MPAFILMILQYLGAAATAAPLIEQLLAGIGTFLAKTFADLFGVSAGAELQAILTRAENIVTVVGQDAPAAADFVRNTYTDLEALLAAEPWLGQLLYSTHLTSVASPQPLTRSVLNKINELAHANVTVKNA